jgi:hypothetical protein
VLDNSTVPSLGMQNGGSARAYLADSSGRQRFGHDGIHGTIASIPWIFMQAVVPPDSTHLPLIAHHHSRNECSSARISIHELEYHSGLLDLGRRSSCSLSIVLVGNQIAEYLLRVDDEFA